MRAHLEYASESGGGRKEPGRRGKRTREEEKRAERTREEGKRNREGEEKRAEKNQGGEGSLPMPASHTFVSYFRVFQMSTIPRLFGQHL